MTTPTAPSLFGNTPPPAPLAVFAPAHAEHSLLDLMYDGFYLLFLLKNKSLPQDEAHFAVQVKKFLADFEKGAKRLEATAEEIFDAKYAFCAAVDETLLRSGGKIRESWERHPLQLIMFGEQLAGENFFIKLEALRSQGKTRVQVLEIFHMCLLLGFQGKYLLEGPEKLAYLTARLGEEIAAMKGQRRGFAPHWELPDRVAHALKRDLPVWVMASAFALLALVGFLAVSWSLGAHTSDTLNQYGGVVKLAPKVANITITLP
ncbi:MAG: DotU family type IV/VI secretion system protein [Burkholderiales bacterium]|jgi:type VI secretion system protein ImpK|nr:DotU family type IV/VI secretion system protein [Burkholderiales bacterium]